MTANLVERAETLPAIEAEPQRGSMLAIIARAASDPNVDVGKMQALLDMQAQIMAEQARAAFNAAFARLNLPRIPKLGIVDRGQGKGKFPYAKWEDIDAKIRPLLSAEGFSLSFDTKPCGEGHIVVIGTLRHREGHCETASIGPLALDTSGNKNPVQAVGSTTSYGKRYTASMLLNLTFGGDDDDGKAGGEVGASRFITDEQIVEINSLIRETESDSVKVLAFADNAPSVPEMTAVQYQKARDMLLRKKNRMAREVEAQQ